ncbi:MAG: HDOD domain-containing protein [Syntrophobacteraceae bacterium]
MSIYPLDEEEVRYQVSRIQELQPLPQSIQRLIEIIYSEIDSPRELESIICYDQSLATKVLRIANSTYYGYRGGVKTLSKAIVVIGLDRVKSICLCTLLVNLVANGAFISRFHRELLWKHAFSTSVIASEMTKKRRWISREEASVLGLVHDMGQMVLAVHFNEQFSAIMETAVRNKIPPWCVESQYGLAHTQLGKYLASRWAFPAVFQSVIEFHHCPVRSESFKTEVGLIFLANILSNSREYPELVKDEATLSVCREMYISEDEWQEHQDNLIHVWPIVDQLWSLLG